MALENSIRIDTIIFIVTSSYIILSLINKRRKQSNLFIVLFFIMLNSSYNIMIKKIHDFNEVIPRNFIYMYDVFFKFSLIDIVFITLFVINFKKIIKTFFEDEISFILLQRELFVFLISFTSFLINKGYFLDNGNRFLVLSKGIIYFAVSFYYFKKNNFYEEKHIKLFSIILISGMISLFFFSIEDVWVRYGNKVTIIDQEDAYSISNFIVLYFFIGLIERKKLNYLILFLIFLLQNVLSMYKMNLIFLPLCILTYFTFFYRNNKNKNLKVIIIMLIFLLFIVIVLFNINEILYLINSLAIDTRKVQIKDLMASLDNPYKILFGLGHGTPYFSIEDTGDLGEVKIIDKALYSGYRFDVQTPIFTIFKNVGIIGLLIFFLYSFIIFFKIKHNLKQKYIYSIQEKTIILFSLLNLFLTNYTINGNPSDSVFYGYLLGNLCNLFNLDSASNAERH